MTQDEHIKELTNCLEEAINLIHAILEGEYTPDSLTTQPWEQAILNLQDYSERSQ